MPSRFAAGRSRTILAALAALVLLLVGTFVAYTLLFSEGTGRTLHIERTENEAGALVLDPAEVREVVPLFAEALETADAEGTAAISGDEQVKQVCDYLVSRFGDCGPIVSYEGTTFRLSVTVR